MNQDGRNMNQHTKVHTENVTLTAADGYPVAATRYAGQGTVKGNLVMAGATGVRREFYRRFAEFASRRGYTVLTLDYRGIGHMGYFREKAEPLWADVIAWIDGQLGVSIF
jgi:predicted alpha/beta hydrolase